MRFYVAWNIMCAGTSTHARPPRLDGEIYILSMAGADCFSVMRPRFKSDGFGRGRHVLWRSCGSVLREFGKSTVADFVGDRILFPSRARHRRRSATCFVVFTYIRGANMRASAWLFRAFGCSFNVGIFDRTGDCVLFYAVLGGMRASPNTQVAHIWCDFRPIPVRPFHQR